MTLSEILVKLLLNFCAIVFIHGNAFENVCKIVAILSEPQFVKMMKDLGSVEYIHLATMMKLQYWYPVILSWSL